MIKSFRCIVDQRATVCLTVYTASLLLIMHALSQLTTPSGEGKSDEAKKAAAEGSEVGKGGAQSPLVRKIDFGGDEGEGKQGSNVC